MHWALVILSLMYIVNEVLIGFGIATESEADANAKALIIKAHVVTIVSWLTCPVLYVVSVIGFAGAGSIVAAQVGYWDFDIISKERRRSRIFVALC